MISKGMYTTSGTVQAGNGIYISRKADDDLVALCREGTFAYILSSRQIGKSSLMLNVMERLLRENIRSVHIDLSSIGEATIDQWYLGLIEPIQDQLKLKMNAKVWWTNQTDLSPSSRMMKFFEIVITEVQEPVVVFVDEIDSTLDLPHFTDDFFVTIRALYNARATNPLFRRLSFVLGGSAAPTDLISNAARTPFNIGQRIELTDFTFDEALPLTKGFAMSPEQAEQVLKRVLYWTNGHPFLTQRLCQRIAEDTTINSNEGVDRACTELFLSDKERESKDHLKYVQYRILQSALDVTSLLDVYSHVLRGQRVSANLADPLVSTLNLAGIVRSDGGVLKVRNRIYLKVFDQVWVQTNMPGEEARRQSAAYRRGQVRATIAASVIMLIMLIGFLGNYSPGNHSIDERSGDPSGTITGNRQDVLDATGIPLMQTEAARGAKKNEPFAVVLADAVGQNRIAENFLWIFITGFMVLFIQAGLALMGSGLSRAKNAASVFVTHIIVSSVGTLGFWLVGFALMSGSMGGAPPLGLSQLGGNDFHGLFGTRGFALSSGFYDVGVYSFFFSQLVSAVTMITLPIGAMVERWRSSAYAVYAIFASTILFPIYGHWVWGYGWLARIGLWGQLGHGMVDFAGSGVVSVIGGFTALAGTIVLGPRLGRFSRDRSSDEIRGHNIPLALLGTFILAFGWFGLTAGSMLGISGGGALRVSIIAINTLMASASGAIAAMLYWWAYNGKPASVMCAKGALSGLVAVAAPCAFVNSLSALIIGAIAGVLVCSSIVLIEKRKIDDPVGAISIHGVCGIWGLFSVGLFADGTYGAGWNGVGISSYHGFLHCGVTGVIFGDWQQLTAQMIGCVAAVLWAFPISYVFFTLQKRLMPIRLTENEERDGLDLHEMGISAYEDLPFNSD